MEVKLAKWTKPNNRPNAQFQTMVGQCLLARLRHDVVVGIFAYQGAPRNERLPTTDEAEKTLARCGIHLVVRNVA